MAFTLLFAQAQGGPVPAVEVEINFGGLSGTPSGDKDTTIFAEILAAGTGTAETLSPEFGSYDEAKDWAGDRSPAAYLAAQWFDVVHSEIGRPKGRLRIAAAKEDADGTAAEVDLTFATNAAKDGTWVFRVGGVLVRVPVQKDDTPIVQATKFKNVWDGMSAPYRLPITVATAAAVVTLTVTVKGAHFNDITLTTETTPVGIGTTATWEEVSFAAGGLGTAGAGVHATGNLTTLLTAIAGVRTKFLVPSFNDDASLEELVTHINDKSDATNGLGGQLVVAIRDSSANAVTAATALDDGDDCDRVVYLGINGDCDWHAAIAMRCQAANAAEAHPARSLDFLVVPGLYVPKDDQAYTKINQRTLIENGVTPLVVQDRAVKIARWTMCKTKWGILDGALPYVADYARDRLLAKISPDARESIVDNGSPVNAAHVTSPEARRGLYHSILKEMEDEAILTNVDANIEAAAILRSDSSTLQAAIPLDMLAQKHNEMIRLDLGLG